MIPLSLVVGGALVLAAGWLLMRRLGPGARVGRILASTRMVPVAEARELAARGANRYVGVFGRVDAEAPFEDDAHRPLVFRRTRLELRSGSRWDAFEDHREVVPFEISEGLDTIAVDGDALDAGLVVVRRESVGTAADLADRVPAGTAPTTPARLRIELLTAVDHAIVLGVPSLDPVVGPILRAGLGRPLVLTNLERDEALRLLSGGRRGTTRMIAILLGAGVVGLLTGLLWAVLDAVVSRVLQALGRGLAAGAGVIGLAILAAMPALAAAPSATPGTGGDPRSSGQGPGLVGDPLFAIGIVVAIGLLALGATLLYVRLTGGPRDA